MNLHLAHENCPMQWDRVENKTSVAVYAGGAVVALWLSSTIVGAVNAVPLVITCCTVTLIGFEMLLTASSNILPLPSSQLP